MTGSNVRRVRSRLRIIWMVSMNRTLDARGMQDVEQGGVIVIDRN